MQAGLFDIKRCVVIVGGFPITGFSEDGAVEVEDNPPIATHKVGVDGSVVISRSADRRLVVVVKVGLHTRAYRILAELMKAQQVLDVFTPMPFYMRNFINGDEITEQYAVFLERPNLTLSGESTSRDFKILLPNGADGEQYGTQNL